MKPASSDVVRSVPLYARLSDDDLEALTAVAEVQLFSRGAAIFTEGEPADHFYTIVRGRVKIHKHRPGGNELILTILGAGDPVGAVAVYLETPFPATAEALEDTVCLRIPRRSFYALIERNPSLVSGLLVGMTQRLMELTSRLADLTGGRVETRFARLFLKLGEEVGKSTDEGVQIPVELSRQELAELTGTTIETCIRIMSRWGKDGTVLTLDRGFLVSDGDRLRELADG